MVSEKEIEGVKSSSIKGKINENLHANEMVIVAKELEVGFCTFRSFHFSLTIVSELMVITAWRKW